MSGIIKSVKKAFRKNPILTTIVVAAAVWFTAGAAAAYFAAPQAGLGGAMSASASSMWTTATTGSYVSAAEVATTNAAATAAAAEGAVTVGSIATEAPVVGTELGASAGAGAGGPGGAAVAPGAEASLTADSIAGTMPAAVDSTAVTAGSTVGGEGSGIVKGAMGWMKENPIPTLILGQAGIGAYSGYLEDKERDREDAYRRSRGLMGVDYGGTYQGGGGIVNSQSVTPRTAEQAVREPNVQGPTPRPIARKNLPKLQQQGLVAKPRV